MPHQCRDFPRRRFSLLFLLLPLLVASCAGLPNPTPEEPGSIYCPPEEPTLFSLYAPFFVPQTLHAAHNRIGLPSVREEGAGGDVFVDPSAAVIYVDMHEFFTARSRYTNLVYRLHFPEVPQFHLTAGKNGGLLVIVTLDKDRKPLLVTTVHTCGCYLVITPTSFLPESAYPDGWNNRNQMRWGETLPAQLEFADNGIDDQRLVVFLRDDTHRVMDLKIVGTREVKRKAASIPLRLEPMSTLNALPVPGGGTTSFFETTGWRQGYVKDSYRPWEMLLIGWWALDLNVGCDKEYGDRQTSQTVFYTSLKPWNRQRSDMRDFAAFLAFWGWKL